MSYKDIIDSARCSIALIPGDGEGSAFHHASDLMDCIDYEYPRAIAHDPVVLGFYPDGTAYDDIADYCVDDALRLIAQAYGVPVDRVSSREV